MRCLDNRNQIGNGNKLKQSRMVEVDFISYFKLSYLQDRSKRLYSSYEKHDFAPSIQKTF